MSNYALQVEGLTKTIKGRTIVDQVSFQVQKGEIFGLLGPNGAGKTTIIRMIVSLINRTGGTVEINGHSLDHSFTQAMNELGAIVENPEFYKYMSGYKNLVHYARMALDDIPKERIEEVVQLVGLEKAIHDKVKTYSLGMRQRLGVAQAILHKPSILILDEPTNGLDPQGIREFRDYLRQLTLDGTSVLVSSHLLSEMQLLCDRFAIIEKGKLTHISTMNDDEQTAEAKGEYAFEVPGAGEAVSVLREQMAGIAVKSNDDRELTVQAMREDIPKINALLVRNGFEIYSILKVKATLEERFLEITNRDKKEEAQ